MASSSPQNISQSTNIFNNNIDKNYKNIFFFEASPIVAVPEPLNILGALIAVNFGIAFRWKLDPKQNLK